jgi:hypothetical protein
MSAPALLDMQARRPARRAGARRPRDEAAAAAHPTRNALVADFLALCELDPDVEALRAPAPPASFACGDETIAHVADFEVVRDGSACLVDIATDTDLMHHPLRAAALRGAQALDGRAFTIETAASIRAEPRFTTMRLILACKRTPVSAGAALNSADGVAAVLALACEGLIAVDISRPILPETQVRRRKVPYADPFEF